MNRVNIIVVAIATVVLLAISNAQIFTLRGRVKCFV